MADRKLIELLIDEDGGGLPVEAISLVAYPAIESEFIFLSKQNKYLSLAAVDEDKRTLIGPALIPEKHIPRFDEKTEEEYDVYFSKETVQRAAEMYLENNRTNEHTYEHATPIDGVHVVESWIVTDPAMDKSKKYGLAVPEGTWMVRVRVDNEEIWQTVKDGKVRGFSIEGYFVDSIEKMGQRRNRDEMMMDTLLKKIQKLFRQRKFYAEVDLTNGKQLVTEADEIAPGVAVYTLDTEGLPLDMPDGSYTTAAGIDLRVAGGILAMYNGEEATAAEEPEQVQDEPAKELRETLLPLYYKKLLEQRTAMSIQKKRNLSYNGWANYETWTIGVWDYIEVLAQDAFDQGEKEVTYSWCADMIYDMLDLDRYDGIVGDWVSAMHGEVDWREIAEHVNEHLVELYMN